MASMLFTSSPLIAQSSFVKRLRTNSKYSGSSWVPKSSIKVSYYVQQLSYKNISVESSKSSFIQGDGFSAFSLPKSSRVLPISKPPSLNALCQLAPLGRDEHDKIYRFTAKQKGKDISFQKYKRNILLIVNIPEPRSEWANCQIKSLNELYAKYKNKGFEIIGFLYDKKEIAQGDKEIDNTEEITGKEEKPEFPVFDKVVLNDNHIPKHRYSISRWIPWDSHQKKRNKDVWYFLRKKSEREVDDVKYPFQKFLVDWEGSITGRFDPFPGPNPPQFGDKVEEAIKEHISRRDGTTI